MPRDKANFGIGTLGGSEKLCSVVPGAGPDRSRVVAQTNAPLLNGGSRPGRSSGGRTDPKMTPRAAPGSTRPKKRATPQADRQFVTALGRGLQILQCFTPSAAEL